MLWSFELEGSRPSTRASRVSPSWQWEALRGRDFGAAHSLDLDPVPIHGNALIRNRAAPIGIKVTCSTGSRDFTGLACNRSTIPLESSFQVGMRLALASNRMGMFSGVKG
jgi:hypothetical protein